MMLPLTLKLLLSACIAVSVSRAACDTVPAFLWSSEAIFNGGGGDESARTDREVRSSSLKAYRSLKDGHSDCIPAWR